MADLFTGINYLPRFGYIRKAAPVLRQIAPSRLDVQPQFNDDDFATIDAPEIMVGGSCRKAVFGPDLMFPAQSLVRRDRA